MFLLFKSWMKPINFLFNVWNYEFFYTNWAQVILSRYWLAYPLSGTEGQCHFVGNLSSVSQYTIVCVKRSWSCNHSNTRAIAGEGIQFSDERAFLTPVEVDSCSSTLIIITNWSAHRLVLVMASCLHRKDCFLSLVLCVLSISVSLML